MKTITILLIGFLIYSEGLAQYTRSGRPIQRMNYGTLTITWVGVIDNGEGDSWPHGPKGSLHILIYSTNLGCPGKQKSYSNYIREVYLPGPTEGEWLDGDTQTYNLGLYNWTSENDCIVVFVYESDPGRIGRAHDPLFCGTICRNNPPNTYYSDGYPANQDAINNCIKRGISWHRNHWISGLTGGIPSMFIRFETR
jgi:hypothetical protein